MKHCIKKIILLAYFVGIIIPMNAGAIVSNDAHVSKKLMLSSQAEQSIESVSSSHSSDEQHCDEDGEGKDCEGCKGSGHCLCAAGCSPLSFMTTFVKSHSLSFNKASINFSLLRENTQQSFLQKIFRPPRP